MWRFLKMPSSKTVAVQVQSDVSRTNRMIRIPSIGFFGRYAESGNKRFTIAWSDSDPKEGVGGFRERGEGTYILLENDAVVLQGHVQRPNSGKVADNGTFLINDWMFGDALQGTFYCFDKEGRTRIKHYLRANLYNNEISRDGKYAVCQCLHSESDDANVLALFDTETGELVWRMRPQSGCAQSFDFDCVSRILFLNYRDEGSFRYSFSGDFLDEALWQEQRVERASGFDLSSMVQRRLKDKERKVSPKEAMELLSLLRKALDKGLDSYPNEKAKVYRSIGEIYEALGKKSEAIENYRSAMQLDPKVGLKRKLNDLQQKKT